MNTPKRLRLVARAINLLLLSYVTMCASAAAQGHGSTLGLSQHGGAPISAPVLVVPQRAPLIVDTRDSGKVRLPDAGDALKPRSGSAVELPKPGDATKGKSLDLGDGGKGKSLDLGDGGKGKSLDLGDGEKVKSLELGDGGKGKSLEQGDGAGALSDKLRASGADNGDSAKARAADALKPDAVVLAEIARLRLQHEARVLALLNLHRDVLEADPHGEPAVRHEILAWSTGHLGRDAALALGISVVSEHSFTALRQSLLVLRTPPQSRTADVLAQLRARDPAGSYDFNNIYSGSAAMPGAPAARGARGTGAPTTPSKRAAPSAGAARIGLIDSGIDPLHGVFRGVAIERWGCDGVSHPSAHGTAVAALMVGQSAQFHGVLRNATLYAADVYCGGATGGSADKIAAALAWFAQQNVAVVNLSLVGPPNQTLERVVAAMVQRGHLLVAAVGNDGPAAAPLYPASYPGVVGVSAVDKDGRCLPEAARGSQVKFAAPGSNMVSAMPGAPPYQPVRGTSFAAPIVAALLAPSLPRADRAGARNALAALAKQARHPDRSAADDETGYGVVGSAYRTDPGALR